MVFSKPPFQLLLTLPITSTSSDGYVKIIEVYSNKEKVWKIIKDIVGCDRTEK